MKAFFGDFLGLTLLIIFVNYFLFTKFDFSNLQKKFSLNILRSMGLEFHASNYFTEVTRDGLFLIMLAFSLPFMWLILLYFGNHFECTFVP